MGKRMMGRGACAAALGFTIFLSWVASISSVNVTYDNRALLIDGQRRFLQSGSIHYPRSTPEMWPGLIDLAKRGGLDVIQTYVFWDGHEPERLLYNFEGRYDLVRFVKVVADAGLYVNLRIGPYVCAEWNFGGFPSWLRMVPDIHFRTDNLAFEAEMERFVTKIVDMMKDNNLFASQGGPIILAQIENEYGNIQSQFGDAAWPYVEWAAKLADGLHTGVPWIMCKQTDAPEHIINTCNGFYCDGFSPNSPSKPKMWTENWAGWYQQWGTLTPHRPVEDIAFAVARFFGKGGSFQNYYMYHGGTNFERTSGEWVTTSYDYDAPINEYGQARQPKWGHLRDLHAAIKLCEPALAVVDGGPFEVSLGSSQEVQIYANGNGSTVEEIIKSSSVCAAFLSNSLTSSASNVRFNGVSFKLPAWSVSILPDCKNVTFNTAMVAAQTAVMQAAPTPTPVKVPGPPTNDDLISLQGWRWESYQEPAGAWGNTSTHSGGFLEQISVTNDTSDYLWYSKSVQVPGPSNQSVLVTVSGVQDAMHLYVNGAYLGSPNVSFASSYSTGVDLAPGNNSIDVLSMTLGLENYGAFLENERAGITQVVLSGLPSGTLDLTNQEWQYQVGMQGETLELFTLAGSKSVNWLSGTTPSQQRLTWYKTTVDAPAGESPVLLDLGSMGKGAAWINGYGLGRFWTLPQGKYELPPHGTCSTDCDYRGTYTPYDCTTGCGEAAQRWYHVPRAWLQPTNNFLVLFEETGGDPTQVSITTQVPQKVCALVYESDQLPKLEVDCSPGFNISQLLFASYGNPHGSCGVFRKGTCHFANSTDSIIQECMGLQKCSFQVSWADFAAEDPCPQILIKSLAIEALCVPI